MTNPAEHPHPDEIGDFLKRLEGSNQGDEHRVDSERAHHWQRVAEMLTLRGYLVRGYDTEDCRLVDLGPFPRAYGRSQTWPMQVGDRKQFPNYLKHIAMDSAEALGFTVRWEQLYGAGWLIREE